MRVVQEVIRQPGELGREPGREAGRELAALQAIEPALLLAFGSVDHFTAPGFAEALRAACPRAVILGCSTAGEINGDGVTDGSCALSAVHFDRVRLMHGSTALADMADSHAAGRRLGRQLAAPDLKAVLVFGPGIGVNGSALVNGLASELPAGVAITGGLAGDGGAFRRTFTLGPDGVSDCTVVAVGFCGDGLLFAHGSFGGWEPFGPSRKVTRCAGNILYELDGAPALAVYKRYLGEHARDLPASGLLFPFAMLGEDHSALGLIRSVLAVDDAAGSLTLAGEIDPNGYLKLMHASTDRLVNGAEAAAEAAAQMLNNPGESLAILVSCVGRKVVMGQRVDEEVEAVGSVLGSKAVLTGFYSYGEISPFTPGTSCHLHNQTMTITCLSET